MTSQRNKAEDTARAFKVIRAEYAQDIMADDDRMLKIKSIVDGLSQVDRTVILLYADCGSLRKLGQRLGLSAPTVGKEVKRIKDEIMAKYRTL